tara:strand:- start:147 stop:578 length:432 start_codon:yes stop_codon:yes gene_type:complete
MSSALAMMKEVVENNEEFINSKEGQMYIWSLLTEKHKEITAKVWLATHPSQFTNSLSSDDESDEDEPEVEEIFINDTKKIWYAMTADPKGGRTGTIFDPDTGGEHPEGITLKDLVHYKTEEYRGEDGDEALREVKLYIINTSK